MKRDTNTTGYRMAMLYGRLNPPLLDRGDGISVEEHVIGLPQAEVARAPGLINREGNHGVARSS
jgi:hypothetical protein